MTFPRVLLSAVLYAAAALSAPLAWAQSASSASWSQLVAPLGLDAVPAPQLVGLQFTLIRQHLYPLTSPYASDLSLPAGGDTASTYTYGVYLGWAPIRHLQLYVDIEQFQGRGIGNSTGLASLTDGDSIRAGSAMLSKGPYVARKFVRYLVPLTAATHAVARGQDQLPGAEPDRYVEIKAGTFAVSDDFDQNRYANSTRTQFENWSLFNNTAWDFAADTRGYTGGVMIGVIGPVWSLRYGLFQMPKYANGQPLCAPVTHCREQDLELTWAPPRAHGLVMRLLAFDNLDNGGDYRQTLAVAQAEGTVPDIVANDRPGRRKYGFAFNLEQPLADDGATGLFLRLGWNDGRTESFAFTEIDQLVSFGTQIAGNHWGRSDDRLGVGVVIGGLSGPHERYLAAGGQGFVIGDGRLNYGQEKVLEAYYRLQPWRFIQISPDFQFIQHPDFNRDRGPASVIGLRVHLQY